MAEQWYRKGAEEVDKLLVVDTSHGLSEKESKDRLLKYGENSLKAAKKINPFKLFASQFKDVLVIILILAAVVSFGLTFLNRVKRRVKQEQPASLLKAARSHK